MIADDHPVLSHGLATMLGEEGIFDVIGIAKNGKELLDLVKKKVPDIAIIDIEMPVLNGLSTIERLTKEFPEVRSIAYTTHNEKSLINELIILGARAFLPKNIDFDKMLTILHKVKNDGYFFDTITSKRLIESSFKLKLYQSQIEQIGMSDRELEILKLVCEEKSNLVIANSLNISVDTVDYHRRNIYKKTKASTVIGLVKYAIKYGIANID